MGEGPSGSFLTTVDYEDVVADTEKEAKRLIEFLGLPWDSKCVDFHKSDRPVKTASVAQVRKPIYKTSVKRWKKYGAGLQPLVDAIEGKPAKGVLQGQVEGQGRRPESKVRLSAPWARRSAGPADRLKRGLNRTCVH